MRKFHSLRFNETVEKHLDQPGQFTKDWVIMNLRENLGRCLLKLEALTGEYSNINGNTNSEDWAEFKAAFGKRPDAPGYTVRRINADNRTGIVAFYTDEEEAIAYIERDCNLFIVEHEPEEEGLIDYFSCLNLQ